MAVKIRLKRMGKIHAPYYRVVVMDSRKKRDGRAIEEIGKYHPTEEPSLIDIDSERAQYWLGVGAQPSEQVAALLKITGDWQKFKGEPGAEGTLKFKEPKADKKALYEAALAAAGGEESDSAPETRRRSAKKDKAEEAPAQEAPAQEAPEESPVEQAPEESLVEQAPEESLVEQAPEESLVEQAPEESPVEETPSADESAPGDDVTGTESAETAPAEGETDKAEG